jgi:glycosyltransferase involved in cell wall biosynthesis
MLSGHGTKRFSGEGVEGLGYVGADTVDALYAQADCVVLPSLYEGFGLPLVEALAWGARVICTDIPPYREQIARYQAGDFVTQVPAGNAEALAAAMRAELDRPAQDWLARLAISRLAASWTWADVAREYMRILEKA